MATVSFIIDCPFCKAKVAANQTGVTEDSGTDEGGEPYANRLYMGSCPRCKSSLVGESRQLGFDGYDDYEDFWSDIVRVYPNPPKSFLSYRVPKIAKESLLEADRSLQASANIAACAMLGRALEAICNDQIKGTGKKMMLAKGIEEMKKLGIIDNRLYEWSQQLRAYRNLAAHPEDIQITREDAEDLQTFVNAIVEYIYDLADRYEDFKARVEAKEKRQKAKAAKKAV